MVHECGYIIKARIYISKPVMMILFYCYVCMSHTIMLGDLYEKLVWKFFSAFTNERCERICEVKSYIRTTSLSSEISSLKFEDILSYAIGKSIYSMYIGQLGTCILGIVSLLCKGNSEIYSYITRQLDRYPVPGASSKLGISSFQYNSVFIWIIHIYICVCVCLVRNNFIRSSTEPFTELVWF